MAYANRGEDRDREQRRSMRGEDPGYDPRDQRGRDTGRPDTWRSYDRDDRGIDQRFDYGGEDRFIDRGWDRGWPNAPEPVGERERGMFPYRADRYPDRYPDRYRPRDDIYYGRPPEFERDRGYGEPGRGGYGGYGGYRDQEYAARDRSDRDLGRDLGRAFALGRPPQVDRDEQIAAPRGYASQGGQVGAHVAGPAPRVRGPHRGKGPAGFQRSDERIKEMVCEALTDHDEVDATDIEVSVKNGEVTLAGAVDDRRMKRLAEECVENVRGVKDVQNQLRVGAERKAGSAITDRSDRSDRSDKADKADKTDKSSQTEKQHRPS